MGSGLPFWNYKEIHSSQLPLLCLGVNGKGPAMHQGQFSLAWSLGAGQQEFPSSALVSCLLGSVAERTYGNTWFAYRMLPVTNQVEDSSVHQIDTDLNSIPVLVLRSLVLSMQNPKKSSYKDCVCWSFKRSPGHFRELQMLYEHLLSSVTSTQIGV